MNRNDEQKNQEQQQSPENQDTHAEQRTPLAERISETGMDQLEEKTDRYTHTTESESKEGTPWSPGQASS